MKIKRLSQFVLYFCVIPVGHMFAGGYQLKGKGSSPVYHTKIFILSINSKYLIQILNQNVRKIC